MPEVYEEQYLPLPNRRTLAYAHGGNLNSSEVVIFFHGVFGVGDFARLHPAFVERDVHYITPTLPGWGKSSSPSSHQSFHDCLYDDIIALVVHLYPQPDHLRLYLGGGSYGTVAAQMLYGAPYDRFPLGRQVAGLLLLAPFSPPHCHKDHSKCLSWLNYFAIGPPSRFIPFNVIQRLGVSMFRHRVDTPEHAAAFIHDFGFKKLTPPEREAYESWRAACGLEEGEAEKNIGRATYRSVEVTWEGFLRVPEVINSNWGGYDPRTLDRGRKAPVLIVMNKEDKDFKLMGEWLVKNMKHATARYDPGGHMAAMFFADEIWAQFLDLASPVSAQTSDIVV